MSNLILVNSVEISPPSEMSISIMDISKTAERNAKGYILIERLATKRKIELSYNYLSRADLSTLLNQIKAEVKPFTFTVTYFDPQTGTTRTGTFYVGDRNTGVMDVINGNIRYKDIKFSFVEV